MCYQKAGEICGSRGYEIVSKSEEPEVSIINEVSILKNRGSLVEAFGTKANQRTMMIACNAT